MPFDFANILVFTLVTIGFIFVALLIGKFVRPHRPDSEKNSTYECGERPIGSAWFNFNPRFYIIALVFIIFEVEIAVMIPAAVVFTDWLNAGRGLTALVEILIFVLILLVGLAYVWRNGDLTWLKSIRRLPDRADAAVDLGSSNPREADRAGEAPVSAQEPTKGEPAPREERLS